MMNELNIILPIALTLFLIMDPLGNTPLFLSLLKDKQTSMQRKILLRELLIALAFIVGFYFIGERILAYLHIDQHTIRIAGGIILFIISVKLIFPQIEKNNSDLNTNDPFIVPIAIPLIAGPSLVAAVSVYAHQINNHTTILLAIFLAWLGNVIIYMSMPCLKIVLKNRGMKACERLMGLILIMISVQMFLDGMSMYIEKQ